MLAVVVYQALFLGAGLLFTPLAGSFVTEGGYFASAGNVFFGLTSGLLIGSAVLVAFVASVGWFGTLFGPQPIRGRWWMWIGVAIPVVAAVLRLFGIDYGSYAPGVVALTMATGLLIGFSEEMITRGIAVKLLRDAGMGEWGVMVISSALFALMHSTNVFMGLSPLTMAMMLAYTFAFGILMYLTLRVTGNLIWPILLHGITDPTLFLASGGIDVAGTTHNLFLDLAAPANTVTIAFGVIALIFVRGRVARTEGAVDGLASPAVKPS